MCSVRLHQFVVNNLPHGYHWQIGSSNGRDIYIAFFDAKIKAGSLSTNIQ